MKSTYRLFPESGYILETYRGVVRLADLVESEERRRDDRRCRSHFHLLTDFRRANVALSAVEVRELVGLLPIPSSLRCRALVLENGRNYAFASLFKAALESLAVRVECFVSIEAASGWLAGQSAAAAPVVQPLGKSRNREPEAPRPTRLADTRSVSAFFDCERIMQ